MNTQLIAVAVNLVGGDGIFMLFLLLLMGFPIWMVIGCVNHESNEGNDKLIWLLVILLAPLGSLIYFFARKLQRASLPPESGNLPE